MVAMKRAKRRENWYATGVRNSRWLVPLVLLIILIGLAFVLRPALTRYFLRPSETSSALPGVQQETLLSDLSSSVLDQFDPDPIQVVAENLTIPWELAFLSDGSLLVTERSGAIVRVWPAERVTLPVQGVRHVGEGGLLGLVLHPEYERTRWVYIYLTTNEGNGLTNRVERYVFDEQTNTLSDRTVILENIPGAANHDGGRLGFGPDGLLYITTGDAQQPAAAQERGSLAGKILRLHDDGRIPADNPFGTAVYSLGHRNPQGLAWDAQGRLWATEHGRSGVQSGFDEVNLIESGRNYGWPDWEGDAVGEGMTPPVLHSGARETWAPAGMAIVGDHLFFTGLRGESLYSARIVGSELQELTRHFVGEYGRLRGLAVSPDNAWLYFTTSNTDGRGTVRSNDDTIIKVRTTLFF